MTRSFATIPAAQIIECKRKFATSRSSRPSNSPDKIPKISALIFGSTYRNRIYTRLVSRDRTSVPPHSKNGKIGKPSINPQPATTRRQKPTTQNQDNHFLLPSFTSTAIFLPIINGSGVLRHRTTSLPASALPLLVLTFPPEPGKTPARPVRGSPCDPNLCRRCAIKNSPVA